MSGPPALAADLAHDPIGCRRRALAPASRRRRGRDRQRADGAVPSARTGCGDWPERPAAILAFPVGFVGAAESKQALIESGLDVPWVTLRGRRGGSAMAAAAVNALLVDPS